jgi:hypothetical protein
MTMKNFAVSVLAAGALSLKPPIDPVMTGWVVDLDFG